MDKNDMLELSGRTERLVGAITSSILSTVEVAADRISLAAEAARVTQRLAAYSSILEAVGAQKDALAAKLATAKGPMRLLVKHQMELLTAQEAAVLERVGLPADTARTAVEAADAPAYRRLGSRFVKANGAGGGDAHGGDAASAG